MTLAIRSFKQDDLDEAIALWNTIVETGEAFPQTESLTKEAGAAFFASQTYVGIAEHEDRVAGLYILHPNNVGRCAHIANASYAVSKAARGKGIGQSLVEDSLKIAKKRGFRIMQFNAVVVTNTTAISLYEKLGFTHLGTIPQGFKLDNKTYADIIPFYKEL